MFDIGFSELVVILIVGLIVLGPARLPVAVRTVASWIRTLRSLATSVQHELSQELKLQELQESLKKAEKSGLQNLTPELKASMDELKEAAKLMQRSYQSASAEHPEANPTEKQPTIHKTVEQKARHDDQTGAEEDGTRHSVSEHEAIADQPENSIPLIPESSTTPHPTLQDSAKHGR